MFPQVSVQAADVKSVIQVYSIEVAARDVSDLDEEPIVLRLRKVSTSSILTQLIEGYPLHARNDGLSLSAGRRSQLRRRIRSSHTVAAYQPIINHLVPCSGHIPFHFKD